MAAPRSRTPPAVTTTSPSLASQSVSERESPPQLDPHRPGLVPGLCLLVCERRISPQCRRRLGSIHSFTDPKYRVGFVTCADSLGTRRLLQNACPVVTMPGLTEELIA